MQALTALRSAFAGMSVRDDSSSGNSVQECEVVEVKNTCPFRQRTGLTKKGNPRMSYMLADPGPRERVRHAPSETLLPWCSDGACCDQQHASFESRCYDLDSAIDARA